MELKNGETYNGHLVNCDTWMNIHLREVICTSKVCSSLLHLGLGANTLSKFEMLFVFSDACFGFWSNSFCRMVIGFGECPSVMFVEIPLSTFEFLMR